MGSIWLWFRLRWRGIGAGGVLLLALVLVGLVLTTRSGVALTFLGNASAARPTDMSSIGMLMQDSNPHSSTLDTNAPVGAGQRSATEAQATWSAAEVARHQQAILVAYNCVRAQHGLPAVTLDAALSETAGAAWLRLSHDHAFSLMDLPGDYVTRSVLALDSAPLDAPAAPAAEPSETAAAGVAGCPADGFDAATLPLTPQAHTIGIAVFPPQARWDGASAIVLVKE